MEIFGAAALIFGAALFAEAPEPARENVSGPKMICLKYASFRLDSGERIITASGGMESFHLSIEGPSGGLKISESEIFPKRQEIGEPIAARSDARIFRSGKDYAFYGRVPFSVYGAAAGPRPKEEKLFVIVSGDALRDPAVAANVLDRLTLGLPSGSCDHRYLYGWEYMFESGQ